MSDEDTNQKFLYTSIVNIYNESMNISYPKMRETFFKFMIKRFLIVEKTYVHHTYAKEWRMRFCSSEPETYMDGISRATFEEVKKEVTLE